MAEGVSELIVLATDSDLTRCSGCVALRHSPMKCEISSGVCFVPPYSLCVLQMLLQSVLRPGSGVSAGSLAVGVPALLASLGSAVEGAAAANPGQAQVSGAASLAAVQICLPTVVANNEASHRLEMRGVEPHSWTVSESCCANTHLSRRMTCSARVPDGVRIDISARPAIPRAGCMNVVRIRGEVQSTAALLLIGTVSSCRQ